MIGTYQTPIQPETGARIARHVMTTVRVLGGSWFLAMATGMLLDPGRRSILDFALPTEMAAQVSAGYLIGFAVLLMAGRLIRPTALFLSAYTLWTLSLHFLPVAGVQATVALWADLTVLAVLLLIAVTDRTRAVAMEPQTFGDRIAAARSVQHAVPPQKPVTDNLFADVFDTDKRDLHARRVRF